jgi:hypothetical protein
LRENAVEAFSSFSACGSMPAGCAGAVCGSSAAAANAQAAIKDVLHVAFIGLSGRD